MSRRFIYDIDGALSASTLWFIWDPVVNGIRPMNKVVGYGIVAERLRAVAQGATIGSPETTNAVSASTHNGELS